MGAHFVDDALAYLREPRLIPSPADIDDFSEQPEMITSKYPAYDPLSQGAVEEDLAHADKQDFEQPSSTQRRPWDDVDEEFEQMNKQLNLTLFGMGWDKRPFVTSGGAVGFGTKDLEAGDVLCVPFGGESPFLFRKANCTEESYILIGGTRMLNLKSVMASRRFEGVRRRWFRLV